MHPNLALLLLATVAVRAQSDSARIIAVSPGIDIDLHDHQPVQFSVKAHYVLTSIDHAIIAVYAERYAIGPDGCDAAVKHHTEGGTTIPITRGEGDVTARFNWRETLGKVQIPFGASFLGIGVNFWTDHNGRPGKRFARFGSNFFCRPIGP